LHRRFEKMHLFSLALFVVLGGLTLYLRDKLFIMWKPTLINWLFAAGFLISAFIGKQPIIQRMLHSQIAMADLHWRRLNLAWVLFFVFSGCVNLVFAQRYINDQRALVEQVPSISEQQLTNLDCSSGFDATSKPYCEAASHSESVWVNVKVFGLMALTLLFIVGQTVFLMRHMKSDDEIVGPAQDSR